MDYTITMQNINALASKAGEAYMGLNKKIEHNHKTFINPTLQDQTDTRNVAKQVASLVEQAQQELDTAVAEKKNSINTHYHGDVTADQLANINQLAKYGLSEDEIQGYIDKYKNSPALLKAFETVIKEKGWSIKGLTYDNEINFLKTFKSQMQAVINGMQHGTPNSGLPIAAKIAANMLADQIEQWQDRVSSQQYELQRNI